MLSSKMTDPGKTVALGQFEKKFFQQMNELRSENLLCDVRLDINGTVMPCHRLVLVAASPYFRTMFNGNFKESNSDTIALKNMETETFAEILNALYTASICFHPSNAYFILKTSHLLQLEIIEDACVSYIMENPKIHYLVDTCLFARNIRKDELYSKCISSVIDDIVEYGKTDSFEKIPMDVFENILKEVDLSEHDEESITLLIMKWSKKNNARRKDIQILLDVTNLKTTSLLNSSVMSQLFVTCDDNPINDVDVKHNEELHCNSADLPLNLYLDAIDVKTGEHGWSVLKTNVDLDKYVLSSFFPTNSYRKKVCRVETKLYCFEYFKYMGDRNVFSYYDEDNTRFSLPTPKFLISDFEMVAKRTSIYLMGKDTYFSVWLYECELNTWENILVKDDLDCSYCWVSACTFSDGVLYVITAKSTDAITRKKNSLFSIDCDTWKIDQLMKLPPALYKYSSLCVFGSKVVVCDCSRDMGVDNTCRIFDRNDESTCYLKKMKGRRPEVNIFHYNDSLYVVENGRAMVPNEIYDLSSDEWTELPDLPQKITISNMNDVVAIGEVFGVEVNTKW